MLLSLCAEYNRGAVAIFEEAAAGGAAERKKRLTEFVQKLHLELHKRVLAWQQRIEPLLAHETTRHEFEIKYYQAGLLESFSGVETSQKKKRAKHDGSADADTETLA